MTAIIFAPSSRFFVALPSSPDAASNRFYDIYAGPPPNLPAAAEGASVAGATEEHHQQRLQVAGRFVGKLVQMGRVIAQQFAPAIYQLLVEESPPPSPSDGGADDPVKEGRLAAFIRGFHNVIPRATLPTERNQPGGLHRLLHGVSFERLPGWRPRLLFLEPLGEFDLWGAIRSALLDMSPGGVQSLWYLLVGMQGIPIQEILHQQRGIWVAQSAGHVGNRAFLRVDYPLHLLQFSSTANGEAIRALLEPSILHEMAEYFQFRNLLERPPGQSDGDRPIGVEEIRLCWNSASEGLLVALGRSLRSIKACKISVSFPPPRRCLSYSCVVATACIVLEGRPDLEFMRGHQFFLLALYELAAPERRLFARKRDPDSGRVLHDLFPHEVPDEDAHLELLTTAGMLVGRAIYDSISMPFTMSVRLENLIKSGIEDDPGDSGNDSDLCLLRRSRAFVGGIYKVIPSWMFSLLPPAVSAWDQNEAVQPSNWNQSPLAVLRFKLEGPGSGQRHHNRGVPHRIFGWFKRILLRLTRTQASLLFLQLCGKPALTFMDILGGQEPWHFVYAPWMVQIRIGRGRIEIPQCEDEEELLGLLSQALRPLRLSEYLVGPLPMDPEERAISVTNGDIFNPIFELYQQWGAVKCKRGHAGGAGEMPADAPG